MNNHHRVRPSTSLGMLVFGVATLLGLVALVRLQPTRSDVSRNVSSNRRQAIQSSPSNASVLSRYLDRLTVQEPKSHEGLSVFPIVSRSTFPLEDYLTLDEALKRGALIVTEFGSGGQVNSLQLENVSNRFVFGMSGEIMQGAKQDRTLRNDLVVPPRSGKISVNVFCTEHGRWVAQTSSFQDSNAAVPNTVRRVAKVEKEQSRVWSSIADNQAKLGVAAPTQAAKEVYADKRVQQESKPYIDHLSDLPTLDSRSVGVAAAYGGKIIAVDVFGDRDLFRRLYPKLLQSYVVDVIKDSWRGSTSVKDIERILSRATDASWTSGDTDGAGSALEFHSGPLHGSALLYKDMVIHSDLFVTELSARLKKRWDEDQRATTPPNLQLRREQHVR